MKQIVVVDFLVRSQDGQPIAAIEVKNPQELSRDDAASLRRNMLAHGMLPRTPYFLLLSQDTGFLWNESGHKTLNAPTAYEFPMGEVVRRYLPEGDAKERLRGSQLELVVLQWLLSLTSSSQEVKAEPEKSLAPSGFLDSIKGATIIAEARV